MGICYATSSGLAFNEHQETLRCNGKTESVLTRKSVMASHAFAARGVMVSVVIDNLAAGESHESIVRGYQIQDADIQAALHYVADLARDRYVRLPIGAA